MFNNTNPDMQSEEIRVIGNIIDGTKFGGIFVIGRGHTIREQSITAAEYGRMQRVPHQVRLYL